MLERHQGQRLVEGNGVWLLIGIVSVGKVVGCDAAPEQLVVCRGVLMEYDGFAEP
ncbi:MAG: hypothetical protein MK110_15250 [Fuerstiella sp.]|nr:hypothetical protein [Fuerstiella sp.]